MLKHNGISEYTPVVSCNNKTIDQIGAQKHLQMNLQSNGSKFRCQATVKLQFVCQNLFRHFVQKNACDHQLSSDILVEKIMWKYDKLIRKFPFSLCYPKYKRHDNQLWKMFNQLLQNNESNKTCVLSLSTNSYCSYHLLKTHF